MTQINGNNWTLANRDGYVEAHGVEVQRIAATESQCECVRVNGTLHRADDLIVAADRIESRIAGWTLTR